MVRLLAIVEWRKSMMAIVEWRKTLMMWKNLVWDNGRCIRVGSVSSLSFSFRCILGLLRKEEIIQLSLSPVI